MVRPVSTRASSKGVNVAMVALSSSTAGLAATVKMSGTSSTHCDRKVRVSSMLSLTSEPTSNPR